MTPPTLIRDGRDKFGGTLLAFIGGGLSRTSRRRTGLRAPQTAGVADGVAALARVYRGWWDAICPAAGCNGAEYVWREDARLFCHACGNRHAGGRWVAVVFPAELVEIERLLSLRPDELTRNWLPGETVAELVEQNAALGIAEGG